LPRADDSAACLARTAAAPWPGTSLWPKDSSFSRLACRAPASEAERILRWPVRAPPRRVHANTSSGVDRSSRGHQAGRCPGVSAAGPRARSARRPSRARSSGPPRTRPSVVDPPTRNSAQLTVVIGMMMAEHHVGHVPGCARVASPARPQIVTGGRRPARGRPRSPRRRPSSAWTVPATRPSSPSPTDHTPHAARNTHAGPARSNLHISHRARHTDTDQADQIG